MSRGRGKKKHEPALGESADDAKRPRVGVQPDIFQHSPTWSFALCDFDGPFGWGTAEQRDLLRVMEHLKHLEKSKLSEIFGERRRGNHQPRPDQLGKAAQDRLSELRLDPNLVEGMSYTLTATADRAIAGSRRRARLPGTNCGSRRSPR